MNMKRFILIVVMVLMASSLFLIFSYLFNPQPIQIILETGQEITTKNPNYFTITSVLLLIICSFITGAAATYLFYNADIGVIHTEEKKPHVHHDDYSIVLPLLKGDERKVVHILIDNNGEMLQNSLVLRLSLSKVRVTRILASLHSKGIVVKERHGLTNNIRLKHMKQ